LHCPASPEEFQQVADRAHQPPLVANILLATQTEAAKNSHFLDLPEDRFDDRLAHLVHRVASLGLQLVAHGLARRSAWRDFRRCRFNRITVFVAPRGDMQIDPRGRRRIVPILSGSFEGPRIKGILSLGGIDWQITRPDGVTEIEAHYSLETGDGAVIRVVNRGYRHGPLAVMERLAQGDAVDPSEYYFRAAPIFEAPIGRYDWLNRSLFISKGERLRDSVVLDFYEVL
jgi:hypothetical protein